MSIFQCLSHSFRFDFQLIQSCLLFFIIYAIFFQFHSILNFPEFLKASFLLFFFFSVFPFLRYQFSLTFFYAALFLKYLYFYLLILPRWCFIFIFFGLTYLSVLKSKHRFLLLSPCCLFLSFFLHTAASCPFLTYMKQINRSLSKKNWKLIAEVSTSVLQTYSVIEIRLFLPRKNVDCQCISCAFVSSYFNSADT